MSAITYTKLYFILKCRFESVAGHMTASLCEGTSPQPNSAQAATRDNDQQMATQSWFYNLFPKLPAASSAFSRFRKKV